MRVLWFLILLGAAPSVCSSEYGPPEAFVPGKGHNGFLGLTVGADDMIYAGNVSNASVFRIDPRSGETTVFQGFPEGETDDITSAPDGTLYWTSILQGKVYAKKDSQPVRLVADKLPGANPIAFGKDGRLYVGQVFLGDAVWEVDPIGNKPPRKIAENLGGMNGFEIGPDGWLYGPLFFKAQVIKLNVETGETKLVAEGFKTIAACNFDSKGRLYTVDTTTGEVIRIDVATGSKSVVAKLDPYIDNLAFDRQDRLYVSTTIDAAIKEIDLGTGSVRVITSQPLANPGGVALARSGERETLYLADVYALKATDTASGHVDVLGRMFSSDVHWPMSAHARGNKLVLSTWFGPSVQVRDLTSNSVVETMDGFQVPGDALELSDASILVTDFAAGTLIRARGKERKELLSGLQGPLGLADGGDGKVYFTEYGAGKVVEFDLNKGARREVASGLKQPEGIAVSDSGKLVVFEVGERRIVEIDPGSGKLRQLAGNLKGENKALPGWPAFWGLDAVAISASGDIYFSSASENALFRMPRLNK